MFKPNSQMGFDFNLTLLDEPKIKKYHESKEHYFYQNVFLKIDEEDFAVLFSNKASRPNAPINTLVASLVLMANHSWTYEELMNNVCFNLLARLAVGIASTDFCEMPFSEATLFNFQNRILAHYVDTGVDLLENVFKKLTKKQITELKIHTDIQRTDSFMADSNIRRYSRIQLLVEGIIRFHRKLSDTDKKEFKEKFHPYVKYKSSGGFVYNLANDDIKHELEKIGYLYRELLETFKEKYDDGNEYMILTRLFDENFKITLVNKRVKPLRPDQLSSGNLQSPDDTTATYRNKNGEKYHGRKINITETANPKNLVNLLTDVCVADNNVDDGEILNDRIDEIKELTPDINELHHDGAYGNQKNDLKMEACGITPIQTGIKGRAVDRHLAIRQRKGSGNYFVTCPHQRVKALQADKKQKAMFNESICSGCDLRKKCPVKNCVFYFDHLEYLRLKRLTNRDRLPKKRRKLRSNAEASVRECVRRTNGGKLRVRGDFKTSVFAFATAIAINAGRIYRYWTGKAKKLAEKTKKSMTTSAVFENIFNYFFKEQYRFAEDKT